MLLPKWDTTSVPSALFGSTLGDRTLGNVPHHRTVVFDAKHYTTVIFFATVIRALGQRNRYVVISGRAALDATTPTANTFTLMHLQALTLSSGVAHRGANTRRCSFVPAALTGETGGDGGGPVLGVSSVHKTLPRSTGPGAR